MHTSTIMRVPYGNFIHTVEIYRSLLTNSVNPPTVSFIHNVIRDVLVKILGAQYSLADVSIIHVHVLEYGGVGIASQLGEEEKDEGDGVGRAEASTASFITNLFHPVVEMGHCSLHATKATTSQSPSHDWCFHFSGVHHHRDKKCKPSTPTCKTQSLVESAFQEIGSRWVAEPD
ncbi:hypothetical protein ALC60_12650 [Trachymyrmex zeteki]|uniref:Uncharacterized protein n=1 Tax=Mycetomoellerius zeteki TaxID=64791 RepID=A0A151WKC8_9HYME|nr:hypothetical protein ALC60_12650 [Trachymyrmex zeteki]